MNNRQQGWVLITVLLMLLLVSLPLSLLQQEWLFLTAQQSHAVARLQAQLELQSLGEAVAELEGQADDSL